MLNPNDVALVLGISTNIINTALTVSNAFQQSNVERYLVKLLEAHRSGTDLFSLRSREDLQRYVLSIMNKVSHEANVAKIDAWKTATIHIATDFRDNEYKDNFVHILDSLTVFDLTVLHATYTIDNIATVTVDGGAYSDLREKVIALFARKGVPEFAVTHSLKRLASQGLLVELYTDTGAILGAGTELRALEEYAPTPLGPEFMKFVAEIGSASVPSGM